jgi:hypothetical protein
MGHIRWAFLIQLALRALRNIVKINAPILIRKRNQFRREQPAQLEAGKLPSEVRAA